MGNELIVDKNEDSHNSEYGSGWEGSTASLTSSIYHYRHENGRRYHAYKDGQYAFPNDEKEQDRLDIIHHIYVLIFGDDLVRAPIGENPQRILDIGTGTGIWAMDIAGRYPSAEIIGTDLSPIQPSWVPPNVHFQIDDAESEWTWEKESFDLIHIRHLTGAIKDWAALVKQAYNHLKPGAYLEVQEYDMGLFSDDETYNKSTMLWKFYDLANKASEKSGRVFLHLEGIRTLLENAGFVDFHEEMHKLPIGTWPADPKQKERGAFLQLTTETAFEAFGMALFTRDLGMSEKEAREVVDGAERDCKNRKIHSYSKHYFYWVRKPLDPK